MKIQKKFIKLLIFALILIISLQTRVFASTLTLTVTTDKDNYKISETIEVTVDWKENMQATSFKIGYDSEKLEFVSASINGNFYNSKNPGEISINWASLEGTDLTQMKFQFKALKEGKTNVGIKEVSAFADDNLVSPTSYDISTSGTKTIIIETKDQTNPNPENPNIPEQPDNDQKIDDEKKSYESQYDNSLAPNPLPKAGAGTTILITIIVIGMLSVIFFIKNRNFSDI